MQTRYAQADQTPDNTPPANTLPELGRPNERPGTLSPNPQGITFDNRFDGKRLVVSPEYSDQTGLSLGGIFAFPLGESAAGGLVFTAGDRKKELLFNAGFQMDDAQRLILTLGQQRQHLDIGFRSGNEKTAMTQTSGAVSYQFRLERGLLNGAEINAYLADTPSRDLADKSYTLDTATLYELWNDSRRVAGGRVTGLQARLAFTPLPGGVLKLGAGGERQEYDYLAGKQSITRSTGSAEWSQQLAGVYQIKAGADAAVQNRYTLGLSRPFGDGWLFGVNLVGIRSRDGAPDDNQIRLTWSYDFGGKRATSGASIDGNSGGNAAPAWGSLLDQVAQHPGFLPAQVVARLDTSAAPARLISVNKAALPAGASVNTATGAITTPLGFVVTGIAGVTLNGAPFANTGQFALSGNNLVIDPSQITQPAVGVIDTYVITINSFGGGTTLATVLVSRGSVKIDSITFANGDTAAPTTTAAPAVSGTTDIATTLSATINENGTGYYLVQAFAAAAPNVAAVQAGTSFAMTANVAATPAISGLAASTAYKIYFVAKDAANNVQAAVQSVAVTTTATPDVTAPTTTGAPAVSGTTDTATTLSATINENGTGYYLVQAAAAAAPSVAAVQAGTSFAMTANVAATPAISGLAAATAYKIYFVAKDAANNVQAAVQSVNVTTTATPDTTAPVTSSAPSISVAATDTTASVTQTINENGTGYYLVQAAAAAAPSVAAVMAGTSFAMTAGTPAAVSLTGLTPSTAYKVYFVAKDSANNAQAAVSAGLAITTTATPDTTAPTTSAGPSVSGTTDTATTLTATINENGTGYYLVQAAAAAAPSVAAVQAGTSFAMTANVAATPAISGLTASTAYRIYFVAKDAANNVQAAVQSVAVTTTATPDTTPPVTSSAPAISVAATDTTASVTQSINENGTGYYLVLPAADAIPTVAAVKAGTSFAMTANTPAAVSLTGLTPSTAYKVYFVAKDAANNDQAAISAGLAITTTATPDTTAPTTSAGPSASGTTDTATTLSATSNENGTGYYLVQAAAAAAPSVAAVQAGTSFAMTANVAATPAISGLTASTAYKIYFVAKDAANNVQAAVQSVAVTTTATPDVTAPSTPATLTLTGNAGASAGYTNSTTISLAVADVADPSGVSWFVSESSSAPVVGDGGWSSTKPTSFTLSAGDGAKGVYVYVKDNVGNVQASGKTAGITLDTAATTTTAGPSVSGTTTTGTTLSATLNENGTGYYLVQAFAAAAPTVAAVQAGTSFAMTANVAATPAIGGLTAATAYKIYFVAKDAANNVQAAVQSVAVTTNIAPTANNFTYDTNIDNTAKTFSWLALSAAADADGDTLTAAVQAQGAKGTFVVAGNNVTYTPSANQTVSDSGTLRISDGRGGVKDIVVTVNGIDTQAPAAPVLVVSWVGYPPQATFDNSGNGTLSTPPDADLAAWFMSESASAPAAGAAGWNAGKPTSYIFPAPPGSGGTATVCVYVKDTLGNVQQTGACESYLVP